ncbi:MAG: CBU_0592 family membrane protein, partial [Sphingomicrobium sp.]
MTMLDVAIEAIGWVGALLILAAYALLTAGRLKADDRAYQWMNVVGALGFIVNSGWNGAVP